MILGPAAKQQWTLLRNILPYWFFIYHPHCHYVPSGSPLSFMLFGPQYLSKWPSRFFQPVGKETKTERESELANLTSCSGVRTNLCTKVIHNFILSLYFFKIQNCFIVYILNNKLQHQLPESYQEQKLIIMHCKDRDIKISLGKKCICDIVKYFIT